MKGLSFFTIVALITGAATFAAFTIMLKPLVHQEMKPSPTPQVKSVATVASTNKPKSSPTPSPVKILRTYSLAVYGDSMVDTMGEKLEILQQALLQKFPQYAFKLYNYGFGGQNVSDGLERFQKPFSNRERNFPAISELKPDVLILGTFSYNPYNPHDPNKHREALQRLIEQAKTVSPRVYQLIEIAPLKDHFGEGKNGVNWPKEMSSVQAAHILEQLQSAQSLAKSLNVPLVDALLLSQQEDGFGNPFLVNPDDGIHPSYAGHQLMADTIARSLKLP